MDFDNLEQPIHFVSWIVIHESLIQDIDKDITELYHLFLPYSKNFDFEFHWIDIAWWKKYFKNFKIEERLLLIEKLVNIFTKYSIYFFSYWLDKQKHKNKYWVPYHPHVVCFARLLKIIEDFLWEKNEKWLLIMDKNDENKQNIINEFQSYKLKWIWFRDRRVDLNCIIDTVYYTESYNSQLMQLSDVIGYIYANYIVSKFQSKQTINYVKQNLISYIETIQKQWYKLKIE